MAGEKIPETGTPEKVEVTEDTIEIVPSRIATTGALLPVIICDCCGKGFLNWLPSGVDEDPLWYWDGGNVGGYVCGGALRMISRETAIMIADNFQKIGVEAWLRGQRKPDELLQ
jgi:hypothetical protein